MQVAKSRAGAWGGRRGAAAAWGLGKAQGLGHVKGKACVLLHVWVQGIMHANRMKGRQKVGEGRLTPPPQHSSAGGQSPRHSTMAFRVSGSVLRSSAMLLAL